MSMISRAYEWMHNRLSRPDEQGEYSAGRWQDAARRQALTFLNGIEGKVLEIGCGEGLFLSQLARTASAAMLYGIDNDRSRIVRARERLAASGDGARSRLTFAEAPAAPFPAGYFDAVVCVNVTLALPSVGSVALTIAEMSRLSRAGGRIILEYRNAENPLLVLKYRLAPYYDETVRGHPFTMLKSERVDSLLRENGLRVMRRAFLPPSFDHWAWVRRFAPIVVVEAEKVR